MAEIIDHIITVYEHMKSKATMSADGSLVWRGKTTSLISDCGLSNNYYTPVLKYLKGGNYITQLKRGGGGSESVYQLNGEPEPEKYLTISARTNSNISKSAKALRATSAAVADISRLAATVEQHSKILMVMQTSLLAINEKLNVNDQAVRYPLLAIEDDDD